MNYDSRAGADRAREATLSIGRDLELRERQREARAAVAHRRTRLDLVMPVGCVDPDSGRRALTPSPTLVLIGDYLRRSRRLAGMTQTELAKASGISQPMISRIERAKAPGVPIERIVALCQPLGRLFPLGVCPHDHRCAWQPYRPIVRDIDDSTRFMQELLAHSGEPEYADRSREAFDLDDLALINLT